MKISHVWFRNKCLWDGKKLLKLARAKIQFSRALMALNRGKPYFLLGFEMGNTWATRWSSRDKMNFWNGGIYSKGGYFLSGVYLSAEILLAGCNILSRWLHKSRYPSDGSCWGKKTNMWLCIALDPNTGSVQWLGVIIPHLTDLASASAVL